MPIILICWCRNPPLVSHPKKTHGNHHNTTHLPWKIIATMVFFCCCLWQISQLIINLNELRVTRTQALQEATKYPTFSYRDFWGGPTIYLGFNDLSMSISELQYFTNLKKISLNRKVISLSMSLTHRVAPICHQSTLLAQPGLSVVSGLLNWNHLEGKKTGNFFVVFFFRTIWKNHHIWVWRRNTKKIGKK